ncbi:MAG: hypothetical protein ACFFER_11165, partial [Candidatus Thorarchaeota archaeon]
MTGEVGERGRHREGQDESDDDIEKMMKDITDEIEKELEKEQQEGRECYEDSDEAMRKAIKELEEEEEERRRAYEEYMGEIKEKEKERERARHEREEFADKDSMDEFEKKELGRMKKRGEDPEDVLKRWREQYVREVEDYIGDTPEAKEDDDGKEDVDSYSEKPTDDLSYFGDGTGQMYATKSEHKEETGGEPESESEKEIPSKHEKEAENINSSEMDTKPVESNRAKPDAEEDVDSGPRHSPEASEAREADDLPMEKRTRREVAAEGDAEREMHDESESPEKDPKKEFYNRPEEEWRRKYREGFEDRDEEEKEEFREALVAQIKEKEDVERLARKNDYESLLEDEDAMEEIEQYLKAGKALENVDNNQLKEIAEELGVNPEQLKEGDLKDLLPESLKELLNREGDFLWREFDRRYIESFFPESIEELGITETNQMLEDGQKEEAEAWIEIMVMRRENELSSIMKDGKEWYEREQISELSKKYGIDEDEIVSWLRLEDLPSLIEQIGRESIQERIAHDDPVEEIRQLYFEEGRSMKGVADRLGHGSTKPVQRIFREQGWKARPPGVRRKEIDLREMHRLYFEEGFTLKELSVQIGIDRHTMGTIFKEQGWKTRRASAIERNARNVRTNERKSLAKLRGAAKSVSKLRASMKREARRFRRKTTKLVHGVAKKKMPVSSKRVRKDIDLEKLYRLYFVEGKSLNAISKDLGVSSGVLRSRFKEQGWKTRVQEVREAALDIKGIHRLYFEEGLTMKEVAERIGTSTGIVSRIFKKYGWVGRIRSFDSDDERISAKKENASRTSQKIKDLRDKIFGTECRLCGENRKLAIHRKDGTEHDRHFLWRIGFLESINPDEWVPLCIPCHRGVHWLKEFRRFEWDTIEALAEEYHHLESQTIERLRLPDDTVPSSSRYLELKEKHGDDIDSLRAEFFGESCVFCDTRDRKYLPIHRKDGRKHSPRLTISEKYFRTLDPNDWARICNKHHRQVHWAM